MKWAMVISSVDALDGGSSLAMLELSTALARRGESVDVFTVAVRGRELHPLAEVARAAGVRLHLTPARRYSRFRFAPGLLARALRHSRGADVVTLHGFYQFSALVAYAVSLVRRAPLLLEPHGVFEPYQEERGSRFKPLFMRLAGGRIVRRCRSVMVASGQEEIGVRARLGDLARRVTAVGLGVEVPAEAPAHDFAGRRILFLSRVAEKKRLDKLLRAVGLLHAEGVPARLTVCGDGEPEHVAALRAIEVPAGSVSWLGHVDGAERAEVEREQSLFVLPSDNENFGLAVVQAMAVGLPVVTTRQTGAGEHVERADAGWLLDDPDPAELAETVARALADPAELARTIGSALTTNPTRMAS